MFKNKDPTFYIQKISYLPVKIEPIQQVIGYEAS